MMTKKTKSRSQNLKQKPSNTSVEAAPVTFLEHIKELQVRLFIVLIAFLIFAAAAWPFFDVIANVLTRPLGENHELFYLTPGGAFAFIMQVCIYVGLIGALPIIIYQIYRFVMPAVRKTTFRKAVGFTVVSLMLALLGIVFAYVIMLPAALEFLTGFSFNDINPMLTIDSYMGFVMTYLLASALLFQLPLIMIIIDSVKPQTPSNLMKQQGKILLGSFIIAAIISPTPDALNQTLLASPIVVMYQVGIIVIWARHRKRLRKAALQPVAATVHSEVPVTTTRPVMAAATTTMPTTQPIRSVSNLHMDMVTPQRSARHAADRVNSQEPAVTSNRNVPTTSIDGMRRRPSSGVRPTRPATTSRSTARLVAQRPTMASAFRPAESRVRPQTVDGFAIPA